MSREMRSLVDDADEITVSLRRRHAEVLLLPPGKIRHPHELGEARRPIREALIAKKAGERDLDPEEMDRIHGVIGATVLDAVAAGIHPYPLAASMFWEGLATGLLLAELRAKAASDA